MKKATTTSKNRAARKSRNPDELKLSRLYIEQLRSTQKSLGITNKQFVVLCNEKAGMEMVNLRTYGNWIVGRNLPRGAVLFGVRELLPRLTASPNA